MKAGVREGTSFKLCTRASTHPSFQEEVGSKLFLVFCCFSPSSSSFCPCAQLLCLNFQSVVYTTYVRASESHFSPSFVLKTRERERERSFAFSALSTCCWEKFSPARFSTRERRSLHEQGKKMTRKKETLGS